MCIQHRSKKTSQSTKNKKVFEWRVAIAQQELNCLIVCLFLDYNKCGHGLQQVLVAGKLLSTLYDHLER